MIGAVGGTHINCVPSAADQAESRNGKGFLSQNCLMACSFDMRFLYVLSGWEGSDAADAAIDNDARFHDFRIPPGKFYLADAGFALSKGLLVSYRGERYHLNEWQCGNHGPQTKEELFNLRHSSARNVIERIIGILKRRFRILIMPPEYSLKIQSRIPPALSLPPHIDPNMYGTLTESLPSRQARHVGADLRDTVATAMWEDYNNYLQERVRTGTLARAAEEAAVDMDVV